MAPRLRKFLRIFGWFAVGGAALGFLLSVGMAILQATYWVPFLVRVTSVVRSIMLSLASACVGLTMLVIERNLPEIVNRLRGNTE
jgi:hypothetical protein